MPTLPRRHLPRLSAEHYRGNAVVLWTHTIAGRATGWLDSRRHGAFREIVLHAAVREDMMCPIYTMMPDHVHLVWMGVAGGSDQRAGASFLRKQFGQHLTPFEWQHQPHDHVLREHERAREGFSAVCTYVAENPVRKRLVARPEDWPFTGCVVPGYPDLLPSDKKFWELLWRIYNSAVERERVGKARSP